MKKIAFLVSEGFNEDIKRVGSFLNEYALLNPHFEAEGAALEKVVWSSEKPFDGGYDALIPKAVWDYFDRPREFQQFLKKAKEVGLNLQNTADTVLWNMNKRYLKDLHQRGFPVMPVEVLAEGACEQLEEFMASFEDRTVVVKPAVGGGSKDTFRTHGSQWRSHLDIFNKILSETDLVVQEYFPQVEEGEYSFFFFGSELSHTIVKVPAKGDFRAHAFFKAQNLPYEPTPEEIDQVKPFVSASPEPCPYVRVDVILVDGVLQLMELEVIEPYLYFEVTEREVAARRFVKAILDTI